MPLIGTRIRELREARKITQHDLADRLRKRGYGTTQTTVSRWESGQVPRGYVAKALAEELGTSLDELYGSDDDEEAAPVPPIGVVLEQMFRRVVREEIEAVKA